jgi:hypothetical protein
MQKLSCTSSNDLSVILKLQRAVLTVMALSATAALAHGAIVKPAPAPVLSIGRHEIRTIPIAAGLAVDSATFTPSGKVLVAYHKEGSADPREVNLAVLNDDGSAVHNFFSQSLPLRAKDNGIRFMVFPDNRRIFTGDFVIECRRSLDDCSNPELLPVLFPAEVADGEHIAHRWSEIIVAPDNRHIAWTTLLADYSAVVFTGELQRKGAGYAIVKARVVSSLNPFKPDPNHADGVIPQPVRGGEVKQFVDGGAAISMAGAVNRDLANSVVQHLARGDVEPVTDTPGYTETTIFSPDGRLGMTMTTRFSEATDLAVLGLVPRPYPASLNMGLNMFAYTYGVSGVRLSRAGNVGPALIDIQTSKAQPGYLGINLNTSPNWVFYSPMSWHPGGKKGIWTEGLRGSDSRRIQLMELPDYRPAHVVAARRSPDTMAYATSDLSVVPKLAGRSHQIDVKVYGRASGYIAYHRTPALIEKVYVNFSDDGRTVWSGREATQINPRGNSSYMADLQVSGEHSGVMDLTVTFGPLGGAHPASLLLAPDAAGRAQSRGFAEYQGQRLDLSKLVP